MVNRVSIFVNNNYKQRISSYRIMKDINLLYKQLESLYSPSIYVYINNDTKEVFVVGSRNILSVINRNYKDHKYRNFELLFIETCTELEDIKFKVSQWIIRYKQQGYKILNPYLPIKYSIKIDVNKYYQVEVILKPSRGKAKVLRIFTTMQEALEFAKVQEKKYLVENTVNEVTT